MIDLSWNRPLSSLASPCLMPWLFLESLSEAEGASCFRLPRFLSFAGCRSSLKARELRRSFFLFDYALKRSLQLIADRLSAYKWRTKRLSSLLDLSLRCPKSTSIQALGGAGSSDTLVHLNEHPTDAIHGHWSGPPVPAETRICSTIASALVLR
jgi:hypothetical protein